MWLVNREDVGAVAYGRLQRDGAIRTVIPGTAVPHDVDDSSAVRRHVLRQCFPVGGQLTGLGALWVHGYTSLPTRLDVRNPRGRHVRHWERVLPVTFHSVGIASDTDATRDFAGLAPAIADSLRWAPAAVARQVTLDVLASVAGPTLMQLTARVPQYLKNDERAQLAWAAVRREADGQP